MFTYAYEMGNFCLGDAGGYGIADQPPKGPHFRPRARGRKWGPGEGWCAIPYPPKSPRQKFHFIISIFPKKMLHNFRPVGPKYFCRLVCNCKNITE